MTVTDKYIIETYTNLFEKLSAVSKTELLEKLSNSLKSSNNSKSKDFFKSFGAFGSDKSAEEIVKEIKDSRKFVRKEIQF